MSISTSRRKHCLEKLISKSQAPPFCCGITPSEPAAYWMMLPALWAGLPLLSPLAHMPVFSGKHLQRHIQKGALPHLWGPFNNPNKASKETCENPRKSWEKAFYTLLHSPEKFSKCTLRSNISPRNLPEIKLLAPPHLLNQKLQVWIWPCGTAVPSRQRTTCSLVITSSPGAAGKAFGGAGMERGISFQRITSKKYYCLPRNNGLWFLGDKFSYIGLFQLCINIDD